MRIPSASSASRLSVHSSEPFGGAVGGPVLKRRCSFTSTSTRLSTTVLRQFNEYDSHQAPWVGTLPAVADLRSDYADDCARFVGQSISGQADVPIRICKNAIPSAMFDSVAAKFQQMYPAPGGSTCQNNSSSIQANCIVAVGSLSRSIGSEGETPITSTQPSASYRTDGISDAWTMTSRRTTALHVRLAGRLPSHLRELVTHPHRLEWHRRERQPGADHRYLEHHPHLTNEARIGYTFEQSSGRLLLNKGMPRNWAGSSAWRTTFRRYNSPTVSLRVD